MYSYIIEGGHPLSGGITVQGSKNAILPMIVSLVGACGLRLAWIFTFFRMPRFHETRYLYITYPVSWFLTIIAHVICYLIIRKKSCPSNYRTALNYFIF